MRYVRQRKTNTVWLHLYMEPKKQNKLTKITNRNRVIDIEDKHRDCQRGEGEGRRKIGERLRGAKYLYFAK